MNIAILTKIYPDSDDNVLDNATSVVKDFAKSWADAGHNVFVYHNYTKQPGALNLLPAKLVYALNIRFGYSLTPSSVNSSKNDDTIRMEDGVRIARFPQLKLIPGKGLMEFQVKKQFKKIIVDMAREQFVPDVVIAHWEDPNLQLLSMIKRRFGSICVFTCHKIAYLNQPRYLNRALSWLNDIDAMFARSEAIGRQLQDLLKTDVPLPICRSGISSVFFERPLPEEGQRKGVLYVGRLLSYKNIDVLIDACQSAKLNSLRRLRIIGNGPEEHSLRAVKADNVEFLGKQDHSVVVDELDKASVLAMVSTKETFGLAYIEAMARGCIVIAGDDGGMVGIIEDGVNGYLCPPRNAQMLASILERIERLSAEETARIRANAIKTAADYTQERQAKVYLSTALAVAEKHKEKQSR